MTDNQEKKISDFFHEREATFKIFKVLRRVIERNCSAKISVTKTQISFGEDYKYIWVWLPQMWIKKRPVNSISLTIVTGQKLKSKRITESIQPQKGFWTHHILLESKEEIDNEIEELIKASYQFYLKRKDMKDRKRSSKRKPLIKTRSKNHTR